MDQIIASQPMRAELRTAAVARWREEFTWDMVLSKYEALIEKWSG